MNAAAMLGSLGETLAQGAISRALLASAGPVSDRFILSNGTTDLLNGPVGSGKTTAAIKRILRRAVAQPPMIDGSGLRRYVVTCFRETYEQLWNTTIPSWQEMLPPPRVKGNPGDSGIGIWTGAKPRSATHEIAFRDAFGPILLIVRFQGFGVEASPEDLGGFQTTDVYLNELPTLREALFVNLRGRIGRDPPRGRIGLADDSPVPYGAIFADCNAPEPDSWVFRDFWSPEKPASYELFRQPGGLAADAENIANVGRQYYHAQIEANRSRPWWIKTKVDNKPGYNRDADVVYDDFDDDVHVSMVELAAFKELPVVIGFDAGNTPAAAFTQTLPGGQLRILAEVALDRGDEADLARHCNERMAERRFAGCEFAGIADPAAFAGDDTSRGSFAKRLAAELNIKITRAPTNEPGARHAVIREKIERSAGGGAPGLLVDAAHCPTIRRGFAGTFQYRRTHGTNDRSNVIKNPDSHVCDAAEYASLASGTALARKRKSERDRERLERIAEAGRAPRYSPFAHPTSSHRSFR